MDKKKLEKHVEVLHDLDQLLCSQEGCSCGGPLHVVLDDGNMYDRDMRFSREWISKNEHGYDKYILTIASAILDLLEELSPAQRRYWWHHKYEPGYLDRMMELADKNYVEDSHCELKEYVPWVRGEDPQ